jgi:hypothetical protein
MDQDVYLVLKYITLQITLLPLLINVVHEMFGHPNS